MSYVRNAIRTVRTMSPAEQRKILDVTGKHRDGFRDHVILSLALGSGLRESEIEALNVGDIAEKPEPPKGGKGGAGAKRGSRRARGLAIRSRVELRVFAHKGTSKRKDAKPVVQVIFLPRLVRIKLAKFLGWKKRAGESIAFDAPLFCAAPFTRSGKPGERIARRTMRHQFRTWQTRAGFDQTPFTFHELRHTALTTLYRRTKDVVLVQRAARHKSITTTMIYTHASDDDLRRALEEQPS